MSIELLEGKGAHEWEVRPRLPAVEPAVVRHRPQGEKWDPQEGLRAGGGSSGEGRQARRIGGDMRKKGKDKAPPGMEGGLREGRWGSKRRDEGQIWADMEEMRVHGGEEERQKVKATGGGEGSRQELRGGWGRGEPLTC